MRGSSFLTAVLIWVDISLKLLNGCVCYSFSCVQLFVTPRTIAHQASLSMDSPGKNTGVDRHSLLQRNFPTQGSNPGLLHHRQVLNHLSYGEILTIKYHVTSMHIFRKKNILLVQLMTHQKQLTEIHLHHYICKNYLGRKDIIITILKGLLTPGTEQTLLCLPHALWLWK